MDDLISRQAAIDAFNTDEKNMIIVVGMENAMILGKYLNRVLNKIKQLPSAQPTFDARDTQYNLPIGTDCISRQQAIDAVNSRKTAEQSSAGIMRNAVVDFCVDIIKKLPSAQPKRGKWILDRSGAYCCSECMEPCAGYVMMQPRDKFCKMCGAKMEVTE